MKNKDQCWRCEEFIPYNCTCKIFLRAVNSEEYRTCICYSTVKPKRETDFEAIINSIDAGRKTK